MKDEYAFNPFSADRVLINKLTAALSDIVMANEAQDDVGMSMALGEAEALLEEYGWVK
jgi:hypothetical protein